MSSRRCLAALAFTLIVGLALPISSSGQDATPIGTPIASPEATPAASPVASPEAVATGPRLNLAAMTLNDLDIPSEFNLVTERYFRGSDFSELYLGGIISPEEIEATNLLWFYESIYVTPEQTVNLRSYIEEYTDVESAIAGFELLEDEDRIVGQSGDFADEPGPGIGEEPSEISIGTLLTADGEERGRSIDLTFRVGRIVAGVSSDTQAGTEVDRDLVIELARRLHERIEAVLANEPLPQIDYELANKIIPVEGEWYVINEGYYSPFEVFGEEVSAPIADDFESGYLRSAAAGRLQLGELPVPLVAISVAQFGSEESPLYLLSEVDLWQPPYIGIERATLDRIPGASAVIGFEFPNTILAGAEPDSVRLIMIVDSSIVIIDVQGNGEVESAREAATAVATAQAACMTGNGSCDEPDLPSDLFQMPADATPTNQDPVG